VNNMPLLRTGDTQPARALLLQRAGLRPLPNRRIRVRLVPVTSESIQPLVAGDRARHEIAAGRVTDSSTASARNEPRTH